MGIRVEGIPSGMRLTFPLAVLLPLAACVRDETTTPPRNVPSSTVDALKADLRSITVAQERHFSATGAYAATLELLRTSGTVELASDGTVHLLGAPNSYTVSITKSVGPNASVTCRVDVGTGRENDGKLECE